MVNLLERVNFLLKNTKKGLGRHGHLNTNAI